MKLQIGGIGKQQLRGLNIKPRKNIYSGLKISGGIGGKGVNGGGVWGETVYKIIPDCRANGSLARAGGNWKCEISKSVMAGCL